MAAVVGRRSACLKSKSWEKRKSRGKMAEDTSTGEKRGRTSIGNSRGSEAREVEVNLTEKLEQREAAEDGELKSKRLRPRMKGNDRVDVKSGEKVTSAPTTRCSNEAKS